MTSRTVLDGSDDLVLSSWFVGCWLLVIGGWRVSGRVALAWLGSSEAGIRAGLSPEWNWGLDQDSSTPHVRLGDADARGALRKTAGCGG